jgi:carbonic anhydrase
MSSWSYDRDNEWVGKCKDTKDVSRQSPINIDTSLINSKNQENSINECDISCALGVNYKPSSCHVINEFNTPTVYFDSGSFIQFNGHMGDNKYNINNNDVFELHKMTLHTPSMHTFNGLRYDVEIHLYHNSLGDMLNTATNNVTQGNIEGNQAAVKLSPEEGKKGVIIALLFRIGDDNGDPNSFFSQFMNKIPLQASRPEDNKELEVPVDPDWGAHMVLPKNKAFFNYGGSLPVPPCEENWYWIVFEEIGHISKNYFETLNLGFRNNIRSVQSLNGRTVSYNNNPKFDKENLLMIKKMNKKINSYQKQITKAKKEENIEVDDSKKSRAVSSYNSLSSGGTDSGEKCDNNTKSGDNQESVLTSEKWYVKHKKIIKYSILFIVFLLFVLTAISITRYIIVSGTLPKIYAQNITRTSKEEPESAAQAPESAAAAAAAAPAAAAATPPLK